MYIFEIQCKRISKKISEFYKMTQFRQKDSNFFLYLSAEISHHILSRKTLRCQKKSSSHLSHNPASYPKSEIWALFFSSPERNKEKIFSPHLSTPRDEGKKLQSWCGLNPDNPVIWQVSVNRNSLFFFISHRCSRVCDIIIFHNARTCASMDGRLYSPVVLEVGFFLHHPMAKKPRVFSFSRSHGVKKIVIYDGILIREICAKKGWKEKKLKSFFSCIWGAKNFDEKSISSGVASKVIERIWEAKKDIKFILRKRVEFSFHFKRDDHTFCNVIN